jgi:hypothetical protein
MQNPNNWYSSHRPNTDEHTYPMDPASNTPTLTPTGAHNTQALPAVYSFATAARTTHGEDFCHSFDTITHYLYHSCPSLFSSVCGRAHAFLCTATILQREWLSLSFSQPSPIHGACNRVESATIPAALRGRIKLLDYRRR